MKYFRWSLLVLLVMIQQVNGQDEGPRITVKDDGSLKPITISDVTANVKIHGCVAETSFTLSFNNTNNRVLEGNLYFPLPDGAVICGYALDINGKMVDGVIVGKDKARQVFETELRRGIDPGLVESVKGNNFKTRVYPIPANGSRTITVRYLSELPKQDNGNLFVLPLNFKDKLNSFKLKVEVADRSALPKVVKGGMANFSFKKWQKYVIAENEYKNLSLTEDLVVAIPEVGENVTDISKADDGYYFLVNHTPPKQVVKETVATWEDVTLFWDGSRSHSKADHKREFDLIRAIFAELNEPVNLQLIVFRNELDPAQQFTIENGNVDKLIAALKKVDYDGGTQMGALKPPVEGQDACLIFSDGISNFGKDTPASMLNTPVYCFNGLSTANHDFLRSISSKSGGRYFNLKQMVDKKIIQQLFQPSSYRFIRAELNGKPVTNTYPSRAKNVEERFVMSGMLPKFAENSELALYFSTSSGETKVVKVSLDVKNSVEGKLLKKMYGRMMIRELMISPDKNKNELVAAGKKFGMVTTGTSLMVLESLDQYVRHRVLPPKSLPDVRKKYIDIVEAEGRQKQKQKNKALEEVVHMWQEVCKWHDTDFTYDLSKLRNSVKTKKIVRDQDSLAEESMAVNDLQMRRPVQPAPVESRAAESIQNVLSFADSEEDSFGDEGLILEKTKKEGQTKPRMSKISIKAWTPDTPYLTAISADKENAYSVYLEQAQQFGTAPSFYLDCANYFLDNKNDTIGLRILSNIAELELENPALLRVLGHRLTQIGEYELSAGIFEEVLSLRPEDPQSYRDLALVFSEMKQYDRAVALLYKVALKRWARFNQIEKIALVEMNRIIAKAKREGVEIATSVDERLIKVIDTDVRIIMTWDADLTDMDLWVTEPSKEKCFYSHNRTRIGGRMSRDFTQGYGPEEYMLKKAAVGKYLIQSNFYGSRAQQLIGAVTLQVDVFTNYGRADETAQKLTFRLSKNKEVFSVGTISFGDGESGAVTKELTHYQVKPGDTLWRIAKDQLGDPNRWKEILKVNPGLTAETLQGGTIIVLP